jgi:hypothetical protein
VKNAPVVAGIVVGAGAILATIAVIMFAPIPEPVALGSRHPTIEVRDLHDTYNAGEEIHFVVDTQGECTRPGVVIKDTATNQTVMETRPYPIHCPYSDDQAFPHLAWNSTDVAGGQMITIDKQGRYSLTVILFEKQASWQFTVG